jgi:hypothetical protein
VDLFAACGVSGSVGFASELAAPPQLRMKIFLSYSSAQRADAERINERLENDGHSVFFDRESLQPGETYDQEIRKAIAGSKLFIFLVSPASVKSGSYTLTELALLEALDLSQRPALLPVLVAPTDYATLPAFLSARTIYEPRGNVPAEVAAQVDRIAHQLERPAPTLVASRSNQGWSLYIDLAGEQPREIFYRLRGEDQWTSTGWTPQRNFSTGKPMARSDISLWKGAPPPPQIFIKYVDVNGREQGPFTVPFDPMAHFLREARDSLASVPWISIREWPEGHLLAYFTALLAYKDAYTAIRYSIDDQSLSKRLRFKSDPARTEHSIDPDDEIYVEIPMTARCVCVQVSFVDGSATEVKTFEVARLGIDR